MPERRYGHTVNEINGKIYVIGGAIDENSPYPLYSLVYDKASDSWSQLYLFNNTLRGAHGSCVVDGKLYIVGGNDGVVTLATMEMFDPDSNKWTQKESMPTDRGLTACAAIDNKIYVIGGIRGVLPWNFDWAGIQKVEVYDISSNTWTQAADMPTKRWGHSAIAFNGKIYVFGGTSFGNPNIVYRSVEVYDPQTDKWETKSSMSTARYCLTSCLLDSSIYVIGGWQHSSYGPLYDAVEVYNPITDEWRIEKSIPSSRAVLSSVVHDGKVYVYGGARTTHPNYGTSEICELSFDDIFALQPCLDKSYMNKDQDTVLFRTRFSNTLKHPFTSYISVINSDTTQTEILNLYDDGLHADSLADDGLFAVNIPPMKTEDFYLLSIGTIDHQTNKNYITPNRCRFTTAGPLVVDSVETQIYSTSLYSIRPYLKNESLTWTFKNLQIKLTSEDPWITRIAPAYRGCSTISPGEIKTDLIAFGVYYDSLNSPGHFNLKFEVLKDGFAYWMDTIRVDLSVTGINNELTGPFTFSLEQNYPNPFNPSTSIEYRVGSIETVTLKVYDILGNKVATLVNEEKPAGNYEVMWNAGGFASGVYFYQLKAGNFTAAKKLIVLR